METMSYGNGDSLRYSYDALERKSAVYYNESESSAAEYAYSSGGSLGRVDDKLSGRSVNYSYDAIERLTSMTEQSGSVGIQRLRLGYDSSNRLTSKEYAVSPGLDGSFGETRSYGYTYREADGSLTSMSLPGGANFSYAYDPLKRLSSRLLREGETEAVKRSYSYLPGAAENDTTLLISQLRNERGEELYSRFDYSYDPAGNIRSLSETRSSKTRQPEGGAVTASTQTEQSYVYDPQGQLLEEHSFTEAGNGDREAYSLFYSYDSGGNLLSWGDKDQPFTLSYEDGTWPDLLTAFNGDPISYDAIGNPTLWRDNTSFTWMNGRRLASAANLRGLSVSYVYNADGLRTSKTVNGVEHKYIWQGDKLVSEACGGRELEFFYDESGKPYAMSHRSGPNAEAKLYYYVTNLQGDVLSLVDAEGFSAAEYWYNAWGLPMGSSGAMAEVNPLRYRGYYFDQETGLYYLKSRYYDPFVCRFVNADDLGFVGANSDFSSLDLFTYCGNNPVMHKDSIGNLWLVSVAVGVATQFIGDVVGNIVDGKTGIDILKPTSTVGEYIAAGVTSLIPGSGLGGSLIRNVVAEGITMIEDAILGKDVDVADSMLSIGLGITLDLGFEKANDRIRDFINSKGPRNYSSYAHTVRQSNPNATREQIERSMQRSGRRRQTSIRVTSFALNTVRVCLPY